VTLACAFVRQGGTTRVIPVYSRLGLLGCGSWARLASISARHIVSTAFVVACPPARVSAIDTAMLQKLSPGCTTHSRGPELGLGGGAGAAAGGAVVVVVVGAVVVVVTGAVVVVVTGAVVVVVVGAVVAVVVVDDVVWLVVVGAAVVVVLSDDCTAAAGDEDASGGPPATGCPLPQPVTTVARMPTPTNQRSARVTART
jgi:hypothetical protein